MDAMRVCAGFDIGTRNMAVFIGRFDAAGDRVEEVLHLERRALEGDRLWEKELDAGRWVERLAAERGLAAAAAIGVEQQVQGAVHAQKAQSAVLGALGSLGLAGVTRVVHGRSKGTGCGSYQERKRRGVELAREACRGHTLALEALDTAKADDMADAILIARATTGGVGGKGRSSHRGKYPPAGNNHVSEGVVQGLHGGGPSTAAGDKEGDQADGR